MAEGVPFFVGSVWYITFVLTNVFFVFAAYSLAHFL